MSIPYVYLTSVLGESWGDAQWNIVATLPILKRNSPSHPGNHCVLYHHDLLCFDNSDYWRTENTSWASVGLGVCCLQVHPGVTLLVMCAPGPGACPTFPSLAFVMCVLVAVLCAEPQRQVISATGETRLHIVRSGPSPSSTAWLPLFSKWASICSSGKWVHVVSLHGLSKDSRSGGKWASYTIRGPPKQDHLPEHMAVTKERADWGLGRSKKLQGVKKPFLCSPSKVLLPREKVL